MRSDTSPAALQTIPTARVRACSTTLPTPRTPLVERHHHATHNLRRVASVLRWSHLLELVRPLLHLSIHEGLPLFPVVGILTPHVEILHRRRLESPTELLASSGGGSGSGDGYRRHRSLRRHHRFDLETADERGVAADDG